MRILFIKTCHCNKYKTRKKKEKELSGHVTALGKCRVGLNVTVVGDIVSTMVKLLADKTF